jgi:cyclohexanone monooxygenase
MLAHSDSQPRAAADAPLDVLVIGAGFHGLYQLWRLRDAGFRVLLVDGGAAPGGVWYWNRYPGARVDSSVPNYEFSMETIWRDWRWQERFPGQPELLRYFEHVTRVLDLARDMRLSTWVTAARFDDVARFWRVTTDAGDTLCARVVLPCLGFASRPYVPDLPGLETFTGDCHHTAQWPAAGVALAGRRVGVLGTGASGVQVIQAVAPIASRLTVFQRTPMLALPMRQQRYSAAESAALKRNYPEMFRQRALAQSSYWDIAARRAAAHAAPVAERQQVFDAAWAAGGFQFWAGTYNDILAHPVSNRLAYDYWRDRTRARIHDPARAALLAPTEPPHPFGTKRPALEQDYYEMFNRANVELIDIRDDPILRVEPGGVRTTHGLHELDVLVLATGFDAGTGGLTQMDVRGTDGRSLREVWANGVVTHLGIAVPGFPNWLMLYGPQSPTAFCNGPTCAELQGDWVVDCLQHLRARGLSRIEATPAAAAEWGAHMRVVAGRSLLAEADSWYMGANIPGKTRELLFHPGAQEYLSLCRASAAGGYVGFALA